MPCLVECFIMGFVAHLPFLFINTFPLISLFVRGSVQFFFVVKMVIIFFF